ncbi:GNAT family N-acetyltransferase [Flavobacterium celericrescens]|uniref:GNAT family N-acetyltransferase n=1 Tax=Flavobacterium celericrescens TaxID=2709780 RepID=A0ABX0I9J6_9FLAO|nr:GNAT family N-acetyltransferase [Flavobacterium celericrescens]NHM03843.1 GNAT family N-acetyltransferase [Flavobacterium celericrescens]
MKNYVVKKYQSTSYSLWNEFVATAKNATFLFHRDFIEYHSDRFQDFSLLIFDEKENLKAILPANKVGDTIYSHQGLTYGGLILNQKSKLQDVLEITYNILRFLNENKVSTLNLKQLPSIYAQFPSEEMEYLSFILNAKLVRRDSLSVLDLKTDYSFSKDRKQAINRGIKNNLVIKEETDFKVFWNEILIPNLEQKHNAKPVHTLEEITFLKSKFPKNIRQFNVYKEDEIVAGTTIFVYDKVAKPQYISGNSDKNELGSLDFLYDFLVNEFKHKSYFDFGPSNEENGRKIKEGILFWKESFGSRTMVQNFYEIETKNYSLIENVLI